MKRIIYLLLILNLGLLSCVDDASVRVMPEFNCKDTKVNLAKAAGSSVTSLLYTNVGQVVAQYQAEWLSVDVNAKSVIYTALTQNDGEDARSTVVKLTCGSYTVEVTVTQDSKEPDLSLKVGQSVDDGIGIRRGGIAGHHGRIERVDRRLNEQVRNCKNHVLDACRDAESQNAPDLVAMEPQPLKIEFAGVVQAHHVPHDEDG